MELLETLRQSSADSKEMDTDGTKYENLPNCRFKANQSNGKWVTDILYIHPKQGTLYNFRNLGFTQKQYRGLSARYRAD